MKISYKTLQKFLKDLKSPEEIAKDLIMHTAEVENVIYEGENLKDVFIGQIKTCKKHPESDKLNCTTVTVNGQELSIICGANNVKAGIKVPIALVGAKLKDDFVISKVKIRGQDSQGMICSEDELGLVKERQEGILELPENAPLNMSFREYLGKNDIILEIDNKAINHRPDMFSHIGVAREIEAINGRKLSWEYVKKDFSKLPDLSVQIEDTIAVNRYKCIKVECVKNISSPDYIVRLLASAGVASKGLLVDISNYSLYLYGQPIHCFDAGKVEGKIIVRFAKTGEKFTALNDKQYELTNEDIVIADEKKILCLAGIIGGKSSAVDDNTTSLLVESAHFDQAILRKTGKRLGIRTDALNIYEKDITNGLQDAGASLVIDELEKALPELKLLAHSDVYPKKQEEIKIPFDLDYINKLIGKKYTEKEALEILSSLGIEKKGEALIVPWWRKDLHFKADIAEEIARITGYDLIESTIPEIESGAVIQDDIYKLKCDTRSFFSSIGYFDMYNYSFVNAELMDKCLGNLDNLVPMKNPLSEELTNLKGSLIPNLLLSLQKNTKEYDNLKLFELEKVFRLNEKGDDIIENYFLSGMILTGEEIPYYTIQATLSDFLERVGVLKFTYERGTDLPSFAHNGRTANLIIDGKKIGIVGEIHPKVTRNFEIDGKVGFFELNVDLLKKHLYQVIKAKEVSNFQENEFDLNFLVDKNTDSKNIFNTIKKSGNEVIQKLELIDIYENEEKIPGKRSLTYKIFIQSTEKTLDDNFKAELIKKIIENVKKVGGELRS